jgi:hypothetical protein
MGRGGSEATPTWFLVLETRILVERDRQNGNFPLLLVVSITEGSGPHLSPWPLRFTSYVDKP